jgi:hypothetical protein
MLDGDADDDNTQREAQLEVLLDLLASFFFTSTGGKPFSSTNFLHLCRHTSQFLNHLS